MNMFLWILQAVTALLYLSSGVMKVFMFDKISADVPSFGALPRRGWAALGIIELLCALGLIVPGLTHWHASLTIGAASILGAESLVFIWVHVRYKEVPPIVFSAVLGLAMAFVAYGRAVLSPLS